MIFYIFLGQVWFLLDFGQKRAVPSPVFSARRKSWLEPAKHIGQVGSEWSVIRSSRYNPKLMSLYSCSKMEGV